MQRRNRHVLIYAVAVLAIVLACVTGIECQRARVRRGNEFAAARALSAYCKAQELFRQERHYQGRVKVYANKVDGRGFVDLYRLGGADSQGELLSLIPEEMARATSPAHPYKGYYFVDLAGRGSRGFDHTVDHGLCAVPADYPRSGLRTFIVDVTGDVFWHDTGGKAQSVYPEPGWILPPDVSILPRWLRW